MNTHRKTAAIVGILFIIGTVSGVLAGVVTASIRAGANFPFNISASAASETQWIIGTLCVMLMGLSLAMMPVMLYPIFRKHNQVLALGAVLFRGAIEAISYAIMVISMLLLVTVSELYARAGADASNLQALGAVVVGARDWTEMWGALVFNIGALMVYALFYQTRFVPRWLSAWGFVGGALSVVANVVSMFSPLHVAPDIASGIGLLMIPIAIQEMFFAVWLIARGFNTSAVASLSEKTAAQQLLSAA